MSHPRQWILIICVGLLGIALGWWLKTKALERESYAKIEKSCTQLTEQARTQLQDIRVYYRDDGRNYVTFKAEAEECKPPVAARTDMHTELRILLTDCPSHPADTMMIVRSQALLIKAVCGKARHIKLENELNELVRAHPELAPKGR